MSTIELLAPARNLETGIAAINCGADAIYIGASKFGARAAAGNSLNDIEKLISYAHKFHVKVYVTINTILYDNELEEARQLVYNVYNIGADALIIQDMAFLEMNLPPIPLHASTQTDNRSVEKVQFLEKSGFQRVVLARELTLEQINEIRSKTTVELEYFVHGALCVSFSGQCYMSYLSGGRSGNRGECAQPCRLKYNLLDNNGKEIVKNKHLLSLKDLNRSASLKELIEVGIQSFKIEGRLKDIAYVKNVTAFYRKKLDEILNETNSYSKSSIGKPLLLFQPDAEVSFNRGFTDYFINGRKRGMTNSQTPKSLGKYLGKITETGKNYFVIETAQKINNGDGLCYFSESGELFGCKVNKVENNRIVPYESMIPKKDTMVYRNFDHNFEKQLAQTSCERKMEISLSFEEKENDFLLIAYIPELSQNYKQSFLLEKNVAQNTEQVLYNLRTQLSKTGDTIFKILTITINLSTIYFFPAAKINKIRRIFFQNTENQIHSNFQRKTFKIQPTANQFPQKQLDYKGNVSNHLAKQFYEHHGAETIQPAIETHYNKGVKTVMTTKLCVKYELGYCLKFNQMAKKNFTEPLYLITENRKYLLEFDCQECQMNILLI